MCKLSDGEKKSIFDEREQLNIKGGGKRKSFNNKNRAGLHPSSPEKESGSGDKKREISYLKAKCKELEENMSTIEEADEHQDNVGDQFGGRKGKKQKKRSD